MKSLAVLVPLLLALPSAAHDYPIAPVRVVLRVEPDRIAADIDSDSIYWIEEVVQLHPMPPRDWSVETLAKTEKYVNEHLRLAAGGHRLSGRLITASYIQRPWEVNEQGRFRLRLEYPPIADGGTLSGEIDFFEEYRQERLNEKAPILPMMDFRTRLSIPGRAPRRFELKPEATAFQMPASEARRGAGARLIESLGVGAAALLNLIEGWAALAALALSLGPGVPARRRIALLAIATLLGVGIAPATAPAWLPWAAGLAAAISAERWFGEKAAPWIETPALAALAGAWLSATPALLPRAAPGAFEHVAAAAGMLLATASALVCGTGAVSAYRRRLNEISQTRAADLFERRRRLSATVLILINGYGLFSTLTR